MNEKLKEIKEYLQHPQCDHGSDGHIRDIAEMIPETSDKFLDEIGLSHGEDNIPITLDMYLSKFYDILIDQVCNVISTFEEEE